MVYSWQLWLAPRPTQRTKWVQDDTVLTAQDIVTYQFPIYNGHRAVRETHPLDKQMVRDGKSGPPLCASTLSVLRETLLDQAAAG